MHLTSPDPEGRGMARAIGGALRDACIAPEEIGCITVTAAGSPVYDRMESRAVLAALGPRAAARVPVTTWEPAVGHALAATGALGVVHAAMVLSDGLVRPVFGVERVDPDCQLRYVLEGPVSLDSPCVLALTVGFGGQNGATVVTSLEMAMDLLERSGEPIR
jgi:3-oxoacyl-[acyl-carrier-protein] synthase II